MKIFKNLVSLIDIINLIRLPYTSFILYTMVRVWEFIYYMLYIYIYAIYICYICYIYTYMLYIYAIYICSWSMSWREHISTSLEKKRATGPAQRDLAPGRGPRISRVMMMDANSALRKKLSRFFGMQICMYIIMYIDIHVIYIYIIYSDILI